MTIPTDALVSIVIGTVLMLATLPLVGRAARQAGTATIGRIMGWGLFLKLLAAPAQLFVITRVYQGVADANRYVNQGGVLAGGLRHGHWYFTGSLIGNGVVGIATGLVYTVTGVTRLGGFLVFSWFGFLGLYFFYRAFCIGYPEGDHVRYAALLFFMPSILFWSSAIGKDALMTFFIGLAALGVARLLRRVPRGLVYLCIGLVGATLIRPHVALALLGAAALAFLLRRSRRRSPFNPILKLGTFAVLVVGLFVLAGTTAHFLGIKSLTPSSISKTLKKSQDNLGPNGESAGSGSAFNASGSTSLIRFPNDAATVLFRPFPFEVHSITQLAASVEGLFLLALLMLGIRRLRPLPRAMWHNPYIVMAALYSAVMVFLLASLANFGVISRERVQLLPLFLVLICCPRPATVATRRPLRANQTFRVPSRPVREPVPGPRHRSVETSTTPQTAKPTEPGENGTGRDGQK